MKRVTLLLILSYLAPYAIAQEVPLYETITDNVPKIGITTEVYLGDQMLEQRTGDYRECIIPKNSYEPRASYRIKAKQPLCKRDADSEFYHPNYFIVESCAGSQVPSCTMFVRFFEKKDKYEIHICVSQMMGQGGFCHRKLQIKDIYKNDIEIKDHYFIYTKDSFQQTIEYAGKSGNILKFVYSEFTKGLARDAFNREFQVDLNEGNVLAFKGALIEIESATNINIRYKVIRNFRD